MTEQATPASPIEADIELYGALVDKEPQKPPRSQWIDVWQPVSYTHLTLPTTPYV